MTEYTVWGHVHRDEAPHVIVISVTMFIPPPSGRGKRDVCLQRICNPAPITAAWTSILSNGRTRWSSHQMK